MAGRRRQGRGRSGGGRSGGGGSRGRSQQGGRRGGHGRDGDEKQRRRRREESQPPPRKEPKPYTPPPAPPRPTELIPTEREFRGLRLFPFQVQALDAIHDGKSVLVAAPTGAGKTLVADYAIEEAFEEGWRVVYTAPIKALSNQKYRDFRATYGDRVGILTGDVTLQPDADLLIMTTEVFRNTLFDDPERLREFRFVIHDEIHYLDDSERGTVWEESIIHAPEAMRIVGLSATIPNVRELAAWMAEVRGEQVEVVEMNQRPVPLDHLIWVPDYGAVGVDEACGYLDRRFGERKRMRRERTPERPLDWLQEQELLPALVFVFSRKQCEQYAWENRGRDLLSEEDSEEVLEYFDELTRRYECPASPALRRLRLMARAGVSYHHAGLLPIHKEIVERLFTTGKVRVLFATETFALGINMPARAVLFPSLRKYDGEQIDYMLCRQYGQMAGRAGRQGIDSHGLVLSMVDPRNDKSHGVRRITQGRPEAVNSRFNPDYSAILTLYEKLGDRVVETYERSFACFQRNNRPGARGRPAAEQMALRLDLLKRTGYIEEGELTEKGAFTARVNGYEIQLGEWREAGLFDDISHQEVAVLLMAAVYEPRRDERFNPPRAARMVKLCKRAVGLLEKWQKLEWRAGIEDSTPEANVGFTGPLLLWMDGAPLAKVRELAECADGTLVRNLRLLLQIARQFKKGLAGDEPEMRKQLDAVLKAVDRDEVDARRQLELGQDEVDEGDDEAADDGEEPEAAAEPEPEPEPEEDDLDDEFGLDEEPAVEEEEDDEFGAGLLD